MNFDLSWQTPLTLLYIICVPIKHYFSNCFLLLFLSSWLIWKLQNGRYISFTDKWHTCDSFEQLCCLGRCKASDAGPQRQPRHVSVASFFFCFSNPPRHQLQGRRSSPMQGGRCSVSPPCMGEERGSQCFPWSLCRLCFLHMIVIGHKLYSI